MISIFALRLPSPSARRGLFRPPLFRLGLPLRQGLVAIISAALFACVDEAPTQHHQQTGTAGSLASGDDNPSFTLLGELEFEQIAAQEPGFAGFFYEGSTLVTLVNNSAARSVVGQTVLQAVSATQDPMSVPQSVVVREVEFSFSQLRDWRNAAFGPLDGMKGVTSLDLDEAHNRITVGVVEAGDAAQVRDALLKLGIPSRAINVEVTGSIVMDVSTHSDVELGRRSVDAQQTQTLSDRLRPVRGGMQIARPTKDPSKARGCTLGFSALRDGVDAFITNSHCTYELWATDGTPFYQASPPLPGDYIGAELDDPVRTCHWGIFFNFPCRYSETSLSEYADGVDFAVGTIARTTWRSTSSSQVGSTTIDSSDPYFDIFWVDKYPSHGETVDKMGVTTGWTAGPVTDTCATKWFRVLEKKLLCQYGAAFRSARGDSGAPVFKWSSEGGATLTGIQWGVSGDSTTFFTSWFSPLGGIEKELGQLDVLSETPPPLPLSAGISGPTIVETGETETWWGSASGGKSPYSYEWSGVLSGTGSSITGELWSSGTLDLTVTDAEGTEASTHIIICVLEDRDEDRCPH